MEFSLFAPHVTKVDLVGSWLKRPRALERGDDGTWRVSLSVPDGRHTYRFRLPSQSPFLKGKTVEVTDPQARRINEMAGDATVIEIQDDRDVTTVPDFAWEHDGVPLPADHELVIYELHVSEFGWDGDQRGTFTSVINRLDYLCDLGVNAVELMPVMAFPGVESWGYNVRHPFALETSYGTPEDFKRLVDACHARGMRVIIDLVLNHSESEAPLTQIDFYYWYRDGREGQLSFGPSFDYERHDDTLNIMPARRFALEVTAFWIQEYHIDGYRLDATAILDNFDIVREVRDLAKHHASGKPFYVVAEQIPEDPIIAGPDGPADGAWHQRFQRAIVRWLTEADGASAGEVLDVLQPRASGYTAPGLVVNYLESHDEQTLSHELSAHKLGGDTAFRRHKLGATLMFTAVGIPMLYQGQEFGGYRPRDMEIRSLQWELLEQDYGLHLKSHYAFLAQTRNGSPALTGEDFEPIHLDEAAGVIAYRRGHDAAEVIIVANLCDHERTVTLPFPDGAWRELTRQYDRDVTEGTLSDTFDGCAAKLYVHRQ